MASPKSKGRMLRKDISKSKKIASLSKDARNLFFMIIPHLNSFGKMNGSPYYIKGECVPLLNEYTIKVITKSLKEISNKTNVKFFEYDGLFCIHSINFGEHQDLSKSRLGQDLLPDYSMTTQDIVTSEVEVKGEGEGKNDSPDSDKPKRASTLTDPEWIKTLKDNTAYDGLDVDRIIGKAKAWCDVNGKEHTRRRVVNWLNREDKPLNGNGTKPKSKASQAEWDIFNKAEESTNG